MAARNTMQLTAGHRYFSASSLNYGEDYAWEVFGTSLNDTLYGGAGNDTLYGSGSDDTLAGGTGNDKYEVADAGVTINEFAGEDYDVVEAIGVNLTLTDGAGASKAVGDTLSNLITGNSAANVLNGGGGHDTLEGGGGKDVLRGGDGTDVLTGGVGADTLVFGPAGTGRDVAADFVDGVGRIRIETHGAVGFEDLSLITSGANLVVSLAGAKIGLIRDVTADQLSAEDFEFASLPAPVTADGRAW